MLILYSLIHEDYYTGVQLRHLYLKVSIIQKKAICVEIVMNDCIDLRLFSTASQMVNLFLSYQGFY